MPLMEIRYTEFIRCCDGDHRFQIFGLPCTISDEANSRSGISSKTQLACHGIKVIGIIPVADHDILPIGNNTGVLGAFAIARRITGFPASSNAWIETQMFLFH